jgi:hypothetical protein
MPRVIISSGHTAGNPGIIANGLQEYDVARKIAKYALKYIRLNGLISLSTPPNLELAQRIDWINKTGYAKATNDLAVEVHINDGGKRGFEGWYEGEGNSPSLELTSRIVEALASETGFPNQGIKSEYQHELGSISFLHEVNPISCVVECLYIDNLEDAEYLKQEKNLETLGKGIAKGVLKYFNLEFRDLDAVAPAAPAAQFNPQQDMAQPAIPQPIQQPVPAPMPVTQPIPSPAYDKTLETQTDNYDSDDFDSDLDDEDDDFLDGIKPVTSVPPVYTPPAAPVVQPPAPAYNPPSNNGFGNYTAPSYNPPQAVAPVPSYTPLPSREERKQMIERNYMKILGREPNQNDLNYFLNIGIREDELIKKMIDSQEHIDLVKAKQELIELKDKFSTVQNELNDLKNQSEDSKNIIENLHQSIDQKNIALNKLQYDIKELQTKLADRPMHSTPKGPKKKYQGSFADKVFKAVSDILE